MPSSQLNTIEPAMRLIMELNPRTILDLGVGFGKWGFLCREYLETGKHRVFKRSDWKVRIEGVEVFKPYIDEFGPFQSGIYDRIYHRDLDNPDSHAWIAATHYNLYLAMDVLEHIRSWNSLLESIPPKSAVIAVVPNGESIQGCMFGNPKEEHVVYLTAHDLIPYFDTIHNVGPKLLCVRKPVKEQ